MALSPLNVDLNDVELLRRMVQEGIDSGPGIDADEVFDELLAELEALGAAKSER